MPSFNQLKGDSNQFDNGVPFEYQNVGKQTNLLTKVFAIMFISLLATAGVGYGIAYLLFTLCTDIETLYTAMVVTLVVSAIGSLVMAFVLPKVMSKGKHSLLPSFIIYCLFISGLISSVFIGYDMFIIILTFGVTSLVFGIMALLGYASKGSLNGVKLVIPGLVIGCVFLCVINFFIGSTEIAWLVSFGIFAVILFVTMYDVSRIKQLISSASANDNNLVLYCSFELYLDFINIFIRLLPYIARIYSEK